MDITAITEIRAYHHIMDRTMVLVVEEARVRHLMDIIVEEENQ